MQHDRHVRWNWIRECSRMLSQHHHRCACYLNINKSVNHGQLVGNKFLTLLLVYFPTSSRRCKRIERANNLERVHISHFALCKEVYNTDYLLFKTNSETVYQPTETLTRFFLCCLIQRSVPMMPARIARTMPRTMKPMVEPFSFEDDSPLALSELVLGVAAP